MSRPADTPSRIDAMIQEVLDGTASEITRERLQALRREDPAVDARFETLQRVFTDLDDLETLAMPRTIETETPAPRRRRRAPRRLSRFAWPLAASIAAVFAGILVFGPGADGDLDGTAPATMIAERGAPSAIVWNARDLHVEITPADAPGVLRVTLRDVVGDRRVRLAVESTPWSITGARTAGEVSTPWRADAVEWSTRAQETIEATVSVRRVDGVSAPLELRLEVDGTAAVRTIPPSFLDSATNSGGAGRY